MARQDLEKYIRKTESTKKRDPDSKLVYPGLVLTSDKDFGNREFSINFTPVSQPYVMVEEHHYHDFDQFLFFSGGNVTNLPDLGGTVELTLSEDGKDLQTFTITESTCVYIPAGMYHCPLNFKKINDPAKPILFSNLYFTSNYEKKK